MIGTAAGLIDIWLELAYPIPPISFAPSAPGPAARRAAFSRRVDAGARNIRSSELRRARVGT